MLQAGCSDDKRGRAATLADRAGCLRRARQLDKAVADLDSALMLFPKYTRALFRRAACILEAGKADDAVEGFKDLYRVDRNWPSLSEWLVRAFSLQKRQARGNKYAASASAAEESGSAHSPNSDSFTQYDDIPVSTNTGAASQSHGSNSATGGVTAGDPDKTDANKIAREVDHYAVLGVNTDATEKQVYLNRVGVFMFI